MVKQTASKAFMTFILVIVLVFVTAFVAIAMMAPLTEFFAFFGYESTNTEIWDIFVPLLVLIVGPLLIVILATGMGIGTTSKQSLRFSGRT